LAPISIEETRVTGPAIRIIENWFNQSRNISANLSWSPNGNKLAFVHKEDIWVFNLEKKELIQITNSTEKKSLVRWSPDGSMLSFGAIVDESNMKVEIRIIPSVGGDPITIIKDCTLYSWSTDSKSVAAKSDRKLFIRNIETDKTQIILDFDTYSLSDILNLSWSPDGKNLVFIGYEKANPEKYDHLYKIPAKGGELTELATDDLNWKYDVSWSPDSKWISYCYYKTEKVRPESTIWEADFEEIKEKLTKE